ncbi:MAG: hypothetical protein DDT21_02639 [Syntrophomonadaceae bacterium]|nr:hypothetical protein [Bacillota bacterium]
MLISNQICPDCQHKMHGAIFGDIVTRYQCRVCGLSIPAEPISPVCRHCYTVMLVHSGCWYCPECGAQK